MIFVFAALRVGLAMLEQTLFGFPSRWVSDLPDLSKLDRLGFDSSDDEEIMKL